MNSHPRPTAWHTFTLTCPLTSPCLDATGGTAYWLAIWSNDPSARVHADNGGTIRFAAYPYGTWPSPVNLSGSGGFTYCMYATGPGKTAFQQWKTNNGLPDATPANNDDDHDGLALLAEYALGNDPVTGDPIPFIAAMDGSHLTLTYIKAKAANDITVKAEVSDNLATWLSTNADVAQQWQVVDGTTIQTITARDLTTASPSGARRFMRLKVTQP